MAVDAFVNFTLYDNTTLKGESTDKDHQGWLEVSDFSFDIEQVLNIGSQSSGAGAGKVSFNPFSITKSVDSLSPTLFKMCCSGTPFQSVKLAIRKAGTASTKDYLIYTFKLVGVHTVSWSGNDPLAEIVTFAYGALDISYSKQNADGTLNPAIFAGWDRVHNISDTANNVIQ